MPKGVNMPGGWGKGKDPRVVGGTYRSGYWKKNYKVLSRRGQWLHVEWEDGTKTTHCTAWDSRRDKVVLPTPEVLCKK